MAHLLHGSSLQVFVTCSKALGINISLCSAKLCSSHSGRPSRLPNVGFEQTDTLLQKPCDRQTICMPPAA